MKLIKTADDHDAALEKLEELMISDPKAGSKASEEIELLGFLIENYEKEHHAITPPHPIEAIRFAMSNQELKQADLVPFLGSKSRVSEILSGKRDLTLDMVRKLHNGLGIPLKSLVSDPSFELPEAIDTEDFPVKEMHEKGYFPTSINQKWIDVRSRAEELLHEFFQGRQEHPFPALNRQTTREKSKVDKQALRAWRCRVLDQAAKAPRENFSQNNFNHTVIAQLKALSRLPEAPLLVQSRLAEIGVVLIVEPHLQKTHLDGAAMWHPDGFPVIGLTIRHDREDNFWFTLFHELGHLWHHYDRLEEGFLDTDIDTESTNKLELEADQFALDSFIPSDQWSRLRQLQYAKDIRREAAQMGIPDAVLAGRLRRESSDYRKHRTLIGQGTMSATFLD